MPTKKKAPSLQSVTKKKIRVTRERRRPYDPAAQATDVPLASPATSATAPAPLPAPSVEEAVPHPRESNRVRQDAELLIKNNTIIAMGIGTVPAPIVDAVAVAILQSRMIAQLAKLHGVRHDTVQAWTMTAITGLFTLPAGLASSMVKALPGFGTWLGCASTPLVTGASTYAIGFVYLRHFQTGGTFLTLDPVDARRRYRLALKEGRVAAAQAAATA